jgi:hypothetical protein
MLGVIELLNLIPDGGAVAFDRSEYEMAFRVRYSRRDRARTVYISFREIADTKGWIVADVINKLEDNIKRELEETQRPE